MRIDLTKTYAGVPARTVRDALRRIRVPEQAARAARTPIPVTSLAALARSARLEPAHAQAFADALVAADLLEHASAGGQSGLRVTPDGHSFASANLTTVRRATATRLLAEALERSREWNARPAPLYKVAQIVVFGSFLDPSRDVLGDVDLAVHIGWVGLPSQMFTIPQAEGKKEHSDAWRQVRGRSKAISMHGFHVVEEVLFDQPHRSVFLDPAVTESHLEACDWVYRNVWLPSQ